jgi:hypothetical protein
MLRIAGMAAPFIPGLELAREFWGEVVGPLLAEHFPQVRYAAALLGPGSEVAGFDTARSVDHDWGPRLQVFLGSARHAGAITAMLADRLPASFRGYPVVFPTTRDPGARHRVEVADLGGWLTGWLGFDPRPGVSLLDWLATPAQRLAEVTGGTVFTDGLGELAPLRDRLRWYPEQLWWWAMACQWERIAEEEAFPGRCAEVGDDVGCRVLTARLVRDLVRLAFLMARRHAPYGKWLGTAFSRLPGSDGLGTALHGALSAEPWPVREEHLATAYRLVAARHDALGLTGPLDGSTRPYHDRPFRVLDAGRFATALRDRLTDREILALPAVGTVDQFVDSTGVLTDPRRARAVVRGALSGLVP